MKTIFNFIVGYGKDKLMKINCKTSIHVMERLARWWQAGVETRNAPPGEEEHEEEAPSIRVNWNYTNLADWISTENLLYLPSNNHKEDVNRLEKMLYTF